MPETISATAGGNRRSHGAKPEELAVGFKEGCRFKFQGMGLGSGVWVGSFPPFPKRRCYMSFVKEYMTKERHGVLRNAGGETNG